MIREVRREEIPMCVEVIKKSFITVADEYGFTEENAPKFTAFATTTDRLDWHMDGEHRPILEKIQIRNFLSLIGASERRAWKVKMSLEL